MKKVTPIALLLLTLFLGTTPVVLAGKGNGKGGGIAVAGCFPAFPDHFALHVALLAAGVQPGQLAEEIPFLGALIKREEDLEAVARADRTWP